MRGIGFSCVVCAQMIAGAAGAERIDPSALANLPTADVVIVGEVHDNPAHHANQAVAVMSVQPAALVFEMLTPQKAALVTPELRADPDALGDALGWAASGWPYFAMYHPIFTAAPDAVIYGADLPRDEVRRAVSEGAAVIFGAEAAAYGLDAPLPEQEQRTREALQMEAHCNALPEEILPGMVEAQRLRDAALARAVHAALDETGGPVAVVTGNGHARRDWGLARSLALVAPEAEILAIGQFEAPPEGVPPFDLWLVTAPTERPDPCTGFKAE